MPLTGTYAPSKAEWARKQAERYEESAGAEANELRGKPIIVLTTVGAKTGALRKTALMRVEHDGRYAVVASKGGSPDEPKWAGNMRKHPHVELQDGPVKKDYLAHEAAGAERDEWWARAVEAWPDYANYQTRTDRLIAVFVLEPME
ncbi:nitroreductase family deazaflavin-dependent oxidoreductase [Microbacterium immunditiarum]|uniref:Deazaflavin-dependent oxidoreductase (Nitroreductase family) n=1 Tax=Microbacterium immunditiarum TaxID=337480 RepID=A0A7Y9KKU8_9MICO|nr:nitroreductase family deazaflavin-dependent oxidoreductase [Microbacterium immunditiarum]NYE21220.1 deazaflavin-dependent oxidoreductase (nitroreductase family) [Microbacterium immunditiarum]